MSCNVRKVDCRVENMNPFDTKGRLHANKEYVMYKR